MSIEAMKQALKAFEVATTHFNKDRHEILDACEALRQAIAEAEMMQAATQGRAIKLAMAEANDRRLDAEKQRPVAWMDGYRNIYSLEEKAAGCEEAVIPLYTSPPQRQPLTDEQRNWIVATCPTPRHIIDTVEKMHGIKGGA